MKTSTGNLIKTTNYLISIGPTSGDLRPEGTLLVKRPRLEINVFKTFA